MAYTQTATQTATYTVADIRDVVRQFTTDLKMMARSSGAMSEAEAETTGQDIELMATEGLLKSVDITLLNINGAEVRAVEYTVDEDTGKLTSSRPGGVLWPKTPGGNIRVVVRKAKEFTEGIRGRFNHSWGPSSADTTHSRLSLNGGRDYTSNGYGFRRKDWS